MLKTKNHNSPFSPGFCSCYVINILGQITLCSGGWAAWCIIEYLIASLSSTNSTLVVLPSPTSDNRKCLLIWLNFLLGQSFPQLRTANVNFCFMHTHILQWLGDKAVCVCVCVCVYTHIYTYIFVYVYVYTIVISNECIAKCNRLLSLDYLNHL